MLISVKPKPAAEAFDHVPKYLAAFSIPRNLRRLFHVGEQTELSVFDGIKVRSVIEIPSC